MATKIAIDFDGTLFEDPQENYPRIGAPKWNVINWVIEKSKQSDVKLYLWTLRSGNSLNEAIEACENVGIRFYGIIKDKPDVKIFIDDRALNPKDIE
jgi:hypothetical protein